MKVKDLKLELAKADDESEVLFHGINACNDDNDIEGNMKVMHVQHAHAWKHEIDHMTWDMAHFLNAQPGSVPVVVLGWEEIPRYNGYRSDSFSWRVTVKPET